MHFLFGEEAEVLVNCQLLFYLLVGLEDVGLLVVGGSG